MKRTMYVKLSLCMLLVCIALPVWSQTPQMPRPFSADYTTTTSRGEKISGKWYFSPPKMRIDLTSMPQSQGAASPFGGNLSMIIDSSTHISDMLMPQMQMYMEMNGASERMSPSMRNLQDLSNANGWCGGDAASCTQSGTEVINGRPCDKYIRTDKRGKTTVWIDQKLHFPIKIIDADGATTEFTNINESAPDASLFKVPAGYRPFDPSAFARQHSK